MSVSYKEREEREIERDTDRDRQRQRRQSNEESTLLVLLTRFVSIPRRETDAENFKRE